MLRRRASFLPALHRWCSLRSQADSFINKSNTLHVFATFATMAPSKSSNPRVIYWFRTDLRLHDSPALKAALDLNPEVFYPIWTWDPHYVYRARVGPNRWQFLYVAE
jgi:DNA photolyase